LAHEGVLIHEVFKSRANDATKVGQEDWRYSSNGEEQQMGEDARTVLFHA
jgi:hypothetical protein